MLLQSYEDEIFILPSIPPSWREGEVSGLRARGGFEINLWLGWKAEHNPGYQVKPE